MKTSFQGVIIMTVEQANGNYNYMYDLGLISTGIHAIY